jgi:c-di-GMP phosphodiesterase
MEAPCTSTPPPSTALGFARQPIVDAAGALAGYELRPFGGSCAVAALTGAGVAELTGDVPTYVAADAAAVGALDPATLPGRTILVLGGATHPEPGLLERLDALRASGVGLVLDGSIVDAAPELVRRSQGVRLAPGAAAALPAARAAGLQALARDIGSREEFRACLDAGFDLFQGEVLHRPAIKDADAASPAAVARLRTAAELQATEELEDLERAISLDPALSVRLLRFVNSAAFSLRSRVTSVRHAIALLGARTVRQWALIVLLTEGSGDGAAQDPRQRMVTVTGLARARTCEALARRLRAPDPEAYFLVGLLSIADALLEVELDALLDELPLADDLVAALARREGGKGRALGAAEACERGDWDAAAIGELDGSLLATLHAAALRWSDAAVAGLA